MTEIERILRKKKLLAGMEISVPSVFVGGGRKKSLERAPKETAIE